MAEDTRYQGWTNYETWSVMLFINNESNECINEHTLAAQRGTDALKECFETYFLTNPETDEPYGNLVVQQFVSAAMSEVNWKECAEHLIEDNAPETETE